MINKILAFTALIFYSNVCFAFCHFDHKDERRYVREILPGIFGMRQTETKDYKDRKIKVWSIEVPAGNQNEKIHAMVLVEDLLTKKGSFSYLKKNKDWWTEELSWSTDVEFLDGDTKYRTVDALWGEGTEKKIEALINKVLTTSPRYYLADRSSNVKVDLTMVNIGENEKKSNHSQDIEFQALEWFLKNYKVHGLNEEIEYPAEIKVASSEFQNSRDDKFEANNKKMFFVLVLYEGPSGLVCGTIFAVDPSVSFPKWDIVDLAYANVGNYPKANFFPKDGFEILNDNDQFTVVGDLAIIKSSFASLLKKKTNLYQVTKTIKYETNLKVIPEKEK